MQDLRLLDSDLHCNPAPDHQTLRAANGGELGSMGTLPAMLKLNNRMCHIELHVCQQLSVFLISKPTCIKLSYLEKGWSQTRVASTAALFPPHVSLISSLCWQGNDAIFVIFSVASETPCSLAILVLLRSLDSSCLILRVCLFCDIETLKQNIGPSNQIPWGSVSIDQFSGEQFVLALSRCLSLHFCSSFL